MLINLNTAIAALKSQDGIGSKEEAIQLGPCTLIHGEQSQVIPALLSQGVTVDHVITDPPYAANTHKMAKTNKSVSGQGVKLITFGHYTDEQFIDAVQKALSITRGWVVLTCDYMHARLTYDMPEFVRFGGWVKTNPMPQISADRPGQGIETVIMLHAGRERKRWNRGGESGVWHHNVVNKATVPTEKPLPLILDFVNDFTQEGETVLDSHMGSGTTAIACIKTGRNFIGIEQSKEHFEIAKARIARELVQGNLFTPAPKPTVQQSLFA
jgi:site-specific DNA-methyltransferase (adenine-specific)